MDKRTKWILGLLVTAFLFANPITRRIILWILPLGRGVDDLIVWLALLIAGGIYLVTKWEQINVKQKIQDLGKKENLKSLQITLTIAGVLVSLAIPYVRNEFLDWFFESDPIESPLKFYAYLGLAGTYILLVWLALDKIINKLNKEK